MTNSETLGVDLTNTPRGTEGSMGIKELRKDLQAIRASAQAGDLDQVVRQADHALAELDGSHLLTTTEAAELLGIRSVNSLKLLVRQRGIPYQLHGNRMMIPLDVVEAMQESAEVCDIRAADRAHDATDEPGPQQGLTQQQMGDLSASTPGRVPWNTAE